MKRRQQKVELQRLAIVQGQRLTLRMPRPDDAQAVYAYASDEEVTRFLSWPRHTCLADSERFLQSAVGGWRDGDNLVWLIEGDRGVVGAIGARLSKHNAGIGYVLARKYWGQGYATEALGLVVEALFRWTPVEAVWAMCVIENVSSTRVLEKSGFHYLRTLVNYITCPNLGGAQKDVRLYAVERNGTEIN